jgi:hypothetical protein
VSRMPGLPGILRRVRGFSGYSILRYYVQGARTSRFCEQGTGLLEQVSGCFLINPPGFDDTWSDLHVGEDAHWSAFQGD